MFEILRERALSDCLFEQGVGVLKRMLAHETLTYIETEEVNSIKGQEKSVIITQSDIDEYWRRLK